MSTPYQQYYAIVAKDTTGLTSPRITFNWGYHDAQADIIANRPPRTHTSERALPANDPYYQAGYAARYAENARNLDYKETSENAWNHFTFVMSQCDWEMTLQNILESETRSREYLFTKKQPRETFTRRQRYEIMNYAAGIMPPQNSARRSAMLNIFANKNLMHRMTERETYDIPEYKPAKG